jgi:hypothetical protein
MGTTAWHKTASSTPSQLMTPLRLVLTISALLVSSAANAQVTYPVSVPAACAALAVREGVGTVIRNRYEAVKAKAKLLRLNGRDPEVAQCRQAVQRLQEAMRHKDTGTNREAMRETATSPAAGQSKFDVH